VNGSLEGFVRTRFDVDLIYFPSFPSTLNKRTLLRDGLVAVHVEVDLFRSWISVIPEHYLFGGFLMPDVRMASSRFLNAVPSASTTSSEDVGRGIPAMLLILSA
jgi:hypothetical protein